jgi:probable HAF family extracellular repeat protein
MRLFKKWQRIAACVIALGLVSAIFLRPGHAQLGLTYAIIDLDTLGGVQSKAYGLNNSGRVVGDSTVTAGTVSANPFAYTSGVLTNVGTFGGDTGTAFALNQIGYSVGYAATPSNDKHAFIWSDIFNKLDIGALPGGSFAAAYDINDANQVVGQSEIAPLQDRGFLWQKSTGMQTISSFNGTGATAANGINNAGQIVGWSATPAGATHAFLLSGGTMTDLGTFGGTTSIAQKINDDGVVVGYAGIASNGANQTYHAFRWTASTGLQDIGTLSGGSRSIAYDINSAGTIVGHSEIAPGILHAFVYDSVLGMQDLNSLTGTGGWTLQEARAINDKGQIVGFGLNPSGETHAFLLVPQADEIPGGEPPPCFIAPTAQPIILPQPPPSVKPLQPRKPVAPKGRR